MKRRLAFSSVSHMGFVLIGIASFTDLGISGAMLQMLSHGLIASVLFFLAGVTYDRTHTMLLNEMGYIGKVMPKVFALFTVGALASLALPGMSGFASEIAVFVGITSSDVYSSTFRTVTVFLAAVGVILTPIYLLSMLRQIFYACEGNPTCDINPSCDISDISLRAQGNQEVVCFGTSCALPSESDFSDARPREVFIAVCFLVPIIAIGAYPKMATGFYDATTVVINSQMRQAHSDVSSLKNSPILAHPSAFPTVSEAQAVTVVANK
jgi:NAD(P)H-quinone oxidoreductase subunit 4